MSYKHYNNDELISAIKSCCKELKSKVSNSENSKKEDIQYILELLAEKIDIVKKLIDEEVLDK